MNAEEIVKKLAALIYYQSKPKKGEEKPVSFEDLPEDDQKPWLGKAVTFLGQIDQLNLKLAPKTDPAKEAEIEALLKRRIEDAVAEFFRGIKVWKKDMIPQAELTAKIWQVWRTL